MKFSSVVALLATASTAVADTTKIISACRTGLGTSSKAGKLSTTSYALTLTFRAYEFKTITPSTTLTPKAVSVTVTQIARKTTTTTLQQVTDTLTKINTVFATSSAITSAPTATSTTTFTETTIVRTATIPTADGFVPLRSAFPNAKRTVPEQRKPEERRGRFDVRTPQQQKCTIGKDGKPVFSPALFPTGVKCGALVNVIKTNTITKTAPKTSTFTAPTPTSIASVITTSTITLTEMQANAETTVTVDQTVTLTSTSTSTPIALTSTTTTVTVSQPTATIYAGCGADNIVSGVNGEGLYLFGANKPLNFFDVAARSPQDCCAVCQTTAGCYGYGYAGGCSLIMNNEAPGSCAALPGLLLFNYGPDMDPSPDIAVGNGPCGQFVRGQ